MAHVVTQDARPPVAARVARLAALGALLASMAFGAVAQAVEDEMVPGGQWTLRVKVAQQNQNSAIATDGQTRPMVDYLMHRPGLSKEVSGEVVRNVTATETLLGYGISDTWNLNLALPYLLVRQQSSLGAGSGSAAADAAVDRLKSETVSGLGNLRLTSLHRTVYSDTTSLILGWGIAVPGGPPQNDWVGKTTLDTRVPYSALTGLFHVTTYPQGATRARFDIRLEFDLGFNVQVDTPDGKGVTLSPPNTGNVSLRWIQELEPVGYGIYVRHVSTTQSFLDGVGQRDPTEETRLGLELLWGNLIELEQKPIPWPYQAGFQIEHLIRGFNVPASSRYALFLRTYF